MLIGSPLAPISNLLHGSPIVVEAEPIIIIVW